MRTTLNLDQALLEHAKQRALADRVSLTRLVEDALRAVLAQPRKRDETIRLVTAAGVGVKHGVDLDSGASLRDIMEDAR